MRLLIKSVLLLVFGFSFIALFSQTEKRNLLFSIDGNYQKITTGSGLATNSSVVENHSLLVSPSLGYLISDRWELGVGLDFLWEKENRVNELLFTNLIQIGQMEITSKGFIPNIYLGYHLPIVKNLYFSAAVKLGYGKVKTDYEGINDSYINFSDTTVFNFLDWINSQISSYENSYTTEVLSTQINPTISYYFTDHLGTYLGLGGLQYRIMDWKTESANWAINFNLIYWTLGLRLKL